jgi:twitching motility protein PilT
VTTNPKIGVRSAVPTSAPSTLSTLSRGSRRLADPASPLLEAVRRVRALGGSDLHLAADAVPRARVDGVLVPLEEIAPWSAELLEAELLTVMTAEQRIRFAEDLELDFAWETDDAIRVRANAYRSRGMVGAALRLVPAGVKSVRQLGLPDAVAELAELPRGLVLVTGPTGSGKSATLAAILDRINSTRSCHILTIEDPIEVVHEGKKAVVNQREIDRDTRDYASALRQALRQDPDVILLGELRDAETISVALSAAETGHLVLATLHTPDAAQTIDRIVDVFPAGAQEQVRSQLALTLKAVVAQTLLPRASGSGRVVAAEVLLMTPAIANLVRSGKTHQIASALAMGAAHGMQTMDQRLAELVLEGTVSSSAALQVAHDKEILSRLLRGSLTDWAANAGLPRSA